MTAAIFGLLIIAAGGLAIVYFEGIATKPKHLVICALLLLLAVGLRAMNFDYRTGDYNDFLSHWAEYYRLNGGFEALRDSLGNYNLPYLYFLAAFSYIDVPDLYLIKLLSVFFDLILAWGVARLVYTFTDRRVAVMSAFLATFFLPTVYLNGALWGQCDSIYAAFAIWSIVFALNGRPLLSVLSIALSFGFKLQAVFLMPVFLIFLFAGKIRWHHLAAFPLTYIVTALPAVLCGRPFKDAILLYFDQAGTVGSSLNYNSPSVFAFVPWNADVNTELLTELGIVAAFLFLFLLYLYCWLHRRELDSKSLLVCCLITVIAVPYLLPHMHDRYFFIADVLSLALAFVIPALGFVPALVSFASLLGYHAYLKMQFLLQMHWGAAALLAAIIALLIALMILTVKKSEKNKKRC